MVAEDAALVLVRADDTLDRVIQKVREAGTSTVELLVPDGVTALQTKKDIERLYRSTSSRGIQVLLITSDEATLTAAQGTSVLPISVRDARVRLDTLGNGSSGPHVARKPAAGVGLAAAPSAVQAPPPPTVETDEEFLRALDDLSNASTPPAPAKPRPASTEDEDIFGALDDLSDVFNSAPPRGAASADYDDLAAQLDAFSDVAAADASRETVAARVDAPAPRPRIRPEDIELTDEEKRRASGVKSGAKSQPAARTQRSQRDSVAPRRAAAPQRSGRAPAARSQTRARPSWLLGALIGVLLLLLIGIVGFLVFGNQATVTVNLPLRATQDQPFTDQTIPLLAPGAAASNTAVIADVITVDAVFTTTGQVATETMTPATSAGGLVTVLSQNTQAVTLPAGTEFVAANPQGQEVRFATSEPVTIAPATTARQGAQIITTLGQTDVNVTARAPGSASNVDANTITQLIVPGQAPIPVRVGGALEVTHGPLSGGSEQPVRIVKDTDIQEVLGQALAGLDNQGRQDLAAQANARGGLTVEQTAITPSRETFSQGQGYEVIATPPAGQPVDPNNPVFTVVVKGRFSALATPQDRPLQNQLQAALPEQLAAAGVLKPNDGLAPFITNWRWDGMRLVVDGLLRPIPTSETLNAATQNAIKDSIAGKSRVEADAALQELVQRNVISGYTLPDVNTLPGWNFQIDLNVEAAQS